MVPDLSEASFRGPAGKKLLIVGGSTRAAAWSARRAGFQPVCADLFADSDTRQVAEVIPVRSYPDSLPDDIAHVEADGWFYTGALENRPDLIERMDRSSTSYGPLWGIGSVALRQLRNPIWVASTLSRNGHSVLEIHSGSTPPPADGTWMLKPRSSAGGRAVCLWDEVRQRRGIHEPVYFQRLCTGDVFSAVFQCEVRKLTLLGITRQLPGNKLSGAADPYLYAGSTGPISLSPMSETQATTEDLVIQQIKALADACDLRGFVGIDFIRDQRGTPWILEINPRYTASVEVLEHARRKSMITGIDAPADSTATPRCESSIVTKLVLYAPKSLIVGDLGRSTDDIWSLPTIADIPVPGSQIDGGWPVCTVFSHGITEEESAIRLQRRVDRVWKMVNYRVDEPVKR